MLFGIRNRPLRTTLVRQLATTAALSAVAALVWGAAGAVSAALGGLVNVTAGWAYGWLAMRRTSRTAGEVLLTMFRAEGVKILLIIVQLWLVLANYREMVVAAFLTAFVVTALVSATAIAVKDD
jgi:F0F1-type ATP synthase assembly protein I